MDDRYADKPGFVDMSHTLWRNNDMPAANYIRVRLGPTKDIIGRISHVEPTPTTIAIHNVELSGALIDTPDYRLKRLCESIVRTGRPD